MLGICGGGNCTYASLKVTSAAVVVFSSPCLSFYVYYNSYDLKLRCWRCLSRTRAADASAYQFSRTKPQKKKRLSLLFLRIHTLHLPLLCVEHLSLCLLPLPLASIYTHDYDDDFSHAQEAAAVWRDGLRGFARGAEGAESRLQGCHRHPRRSATARFADGRLLEAGADDWWARSCA